MKVHVLVAEFPYAGQLLLGVYSVEAVAQAEVRRIQSRYSGIGELAMYEVEVDAPANGRGYSG